MGGGGLLLEGCVLQENLQLPHILYTENSCPTPPPPWTTWADTETDKDRVYIFDVLISQWYKYMH